MPSPASASRSAADTGASARARMRGSASTTVTADPSRWNACPSSRPVGPPPITVSRAGSRSMSKTVRLVR